MTFTPAEYEAWKQSQASPSTANLASTSGTHAFRASRSSWVIDSGASAHMTGTPSTLSSLTPTTVYPPVSIADGCSCSVEGYGLMRRDYEVVDFTRSRAKNISELTNLMKMYRIEWYNGK